MEAATWVSLHPQKGMEGFFFGNIGNIGGSQLPWTSFALEYDNIIISWNFFFPLSKLSRQLFNYDVDM